MTCRHDWVRGPLGYQYRDEGIVVHQWCMNCGAERFSYVEEPPKAICIPLPQKQPTGLFIGPC